MAAPHGASRSLMPSWSTIFLLIFVLIFSVQGAPPIPCCNITDIYTAMNPPVSNPNIVLSPGTYTGACGNEAGHFITTTASLTISGAGMNSTIIHCSSGGAFEFTNSSASVLLQNFTVRNSTIVVGQPTMVTITLQNLRLEGIDIPNTYLFVINTGLVQLNDCQLIQGNWARTTLIYAFGINQKTTLSLHNTTFIFSNQPLGSLVLASDTILSVDTISVPPRLSPLRSGDVWFSVTRGKFYVTDFTAMNDPMAPSYFYTLNTADVTMENLVFSSLRMGQNVTSLIHTVSSYVCITGLSVSDVTFTKITTTWGGYGRFFYAILLTEGSFASVVTCTNCHLTAINHVKPNVDGGGFVALQAAQFRCIDCSALNMLSTGSYGRGFLAYCVSDFTLIGPIVVGGTDVSQGSVYLGSSQASISGGYFSSLGSSACPGMYLDGLTTTLSVTNTTFENLTSSNNGAIQLVNAAITVDGCTFRNLTCGFHGAAISLATGNAMISRSTFVNLVAGSTGGAINGFFTGAPPNISIFDSTFVNTVARLGGAIILNKGNLFARNVTFLGSSAIGIGTPSLPPYPDYDRGGVIYAYAGSSPTPWNMTILCDRCTFASCRSAVAGAVFYASSTFGMQVAFSNSTFRQNTALTGGAVVEHNNGPTPSFMISNCVFDGNSARTAPVQLGYSMSSLAVCGYIQNTLFSGNTGATAGAFQLKADACGVTISNVTVTGNVAQNTGGAQIAGMNLIVKDSVFRNNTATSNGNAGALDLPISDTIAIRRTVVELNVVRQSLVVSSGGIRFPNAGTSLDISNCTIRNNTAVGGSGGGVLVGAGTAVVKDSIISGNTVIAQGSLTQSGYGGGIQISSGVLSVTMANVTVNGNSAPLNGGGINIDGGSVIALNITVASNYAGTNGGGIATANDSVLQSRVTILNNYASAAGGGLYIKSTTSMNMTGLFIISGNFAGTSGGGIDAEILTLTCTGPLTVNNNTAGATGGGIAANSMAFLAPNGYVTNIVGNAAGGSGGGVALATDSSLYVGGFAVRIIANRAQGSGGGIYGPVRGNIVFSPTTAASIGFNSAYNGGGLYVNFLSPVVNLAAINIFSNSAARDGGGLYLAVNPQATANLTGLDISNNVAANNGGGAYFGMAASLKGPVLFTRNVASFGGGFYAASAQVRLKNTNFTANSATNAGGAINVVTTPLVSDGSNTFLNNNASVSGPAYRCAPGTTTQTFNRADDYTGNTGPGGMLAADCTSCGCCSNPSKTVYTQAGSCILTPTLGFSDNCSYTCDPGYTANMVRIVTCNPGTPLAISPQVPCDIQNCGLLPTPTPVAYARYAPVACLSNPQIANCSNTILPNGALIGFQCDDGFTMNGGFSSSGGVCGGPPCYARCDPDGSTVSFQNYPTCNATACTQLKADSPSSRQAGVDVIYLPNIEGFPGFEALFSCAQGFARVANAPTQATCDPVDGSALRSWSKDPLPAEICIPLTCQPFTTLPSNGNVSYAAIGQVGTTAKTVCNPGYSVNATDPSVVSTVTCQNDQTWSGNLSACQPQPCDPLLPIILRSYTANATTTGGTGRVTGDSATASCVDGYTGTASTWECVNVGDTIWRQTSAGTFNCRVTQCEAIAAQQNTFLNTTDCNIDAIVPYLSSCTVFCPPGATANPSSKQVTCQQDNTAGAGGPGVYSPALPDCQQCAIGSFAAEGATECTTCGDGARTAHKGATLRTNCLCNQDFYELPSNPGFCMACPVGGLCVGDHEPPIAKPGYASSGDAYILCTPTVACAGNDTCAEGYTGDVCGACVPGYYRLNGYCHVCPTGGVTWRAVVAALVGLIGVLALPLMVRPTAVSERAHGFGSVIIVIIVFQILATYANVQVNWGVDTRGLFDFFSVFNLNVELLAPECYAPTSFYTKFQLTIFMPLIILGVLIVEWLVVSIVVVTRTKTSLPRVFFDQLSLFGASFQFFLMSAYLFLSRATFSIFACYARPDGTRYLFMAPQEPCTTAAWQSNLILGILGVIFYVVGIPALVIGLYWRRRRSQGEILAGKSRTSNFLVKRVVAQRWWWELLVTACKFFIVIATTFVSYDPFLQIAFISIVLFVTCVASLLSQPYRWSKHTGLLALGMAAGLVIILTGSTSVSVQDASSTDAAVIAAFAILMLVTVAIACLEGYIIYVVTRLASHLKLDKAVRTTRPPNGPIAAMTTCEKYTSTYANSLGVVSTISSSGDLATSKSSINGGDRLVGIANVGPSAIVAAAGATVTLVELEGSVDPVSHAFATAITCITSSPGHLACGLASGDVCCWNNPQAANFTQPAVLSGEHGTGVTALVQTGPMVTSGDMRGHVIKRHGMSGKTIRTWRVQGIVTALEEYEGFLVIGLASGALHFYSFITEAMRVERAHASSVLTAQARSGRLATMSAEAIFIWNANGQYAQRVPTGPSPITCLNWSFASSIHTTIDNPIVEQPALTWATQDGALHQATLHAEWDVRDFDPSPFARLLNRLRTRFSPAERAKKDIELSSTTAADDDRIYAELALLSRDVGLSEASWARDTVSPQRAQAVSVALSREAAKRERAAP